MFRAEFEELAHVKKTRYFALLSDPALQRRLDYQLDASGRGHVNRAHALAYIRELHRADAATRADRASHLGAYATSSAPRRGRPCPHCRRRIARRVEHCRHCGLVVAEEAAPTGPRGTRESAEPDSENC